MSVQYELVHVCVCMCACNSCYRQCLKAYSRSRLQSVLSNYLFEFVKNTWRSPLQLNVTTPHISSFINPNIQYMRHIFFSPLIYISIGLLRFTFLSALLCSTRKGFQESVILYNILRSLCAILTLWVTFEDIAGVFVTSPSFFCILDRLIKKITTKS